jgi:hypothetical protein
MLFSLLIAIHVVSAGVWTGMAFLFGAFVLPSIVEAGAGGGAVITGLLKRKVAVIMPIFGVATVLSGAWLWSIDFGSKGGLAWLERPEGIVLSIAALGALHVFVLGILKQRPAAMKLAELAKKAAEGGKASAELLKEIQETQIVFQKVARRVGFELLGILILMSLHGLLAQVG